MNEFFIPFGQIFSALRDRISGAFQFSYEVIHGQTRFNDYRRDKERLAMVLSNPAVLKVFALQCDLFSMGKVCVEDVSGKEPKEIEDDPFLTLIKNPNPFTQTESQFLWDFMFWNMLGTAYCYVDSAIVDREGNKIYFLDPSKIEWPPEWDRRKDKFVFSNAEVKEIKNKEIIYRFDDGSKHPFNYSRMVSVFDLTNSVGNFFKGPSRLEALFKIISNSEHVLDSQNINIRYTGKFIVGAESKVGQIPGLGEEEKKGIIDSMEDSRKNVYPVRSKPTIARFVEDIAKLQLSQEYLSQYFLIGNMYNIPRDVLEAYNSATYENQEKARAAHVNYCLQPKGEQFMDAFEIHFDYKKQKKNIKMSWEHLPFMQVFAKERAETQKVQVEVLNSLLAAGVKIEQINTYLGTEFEIEEPEQIQQDGEGQAQGGQGSNPEAEGAEGEGGTAAADNQKIRLLK